MKMPQRCTKVWRGESQYQLFENHVMAAFLPSMWPIWIAQRPCEIEIMEGPGCAATECGRRVHRTCLCVTLRHCFGFGRLSRARAARSQRTTLHFVSAGEGSERSAPWLHMIRSWARTTAFVMRSGRQASNHCIFERTLLANYLILSSGNQPFFQTKINCFFLFFPFIFAIPRNHHIVRVKVNIAISSAFKVQAQEQQIWQRSEASCHGCHGHFWAVTYLTCLYLSHIFDISLLCIALHLENDEVFDHCRTRPTFGYARLVTQSSFLLLLSVLPLVYNVQMRSFFAQTVHGISWSLFQVQVSKRNTSVPILAGLVETGCDRYHSWASTRHVPCIVFRIENSRMNSVEVCWNSLKSFESWPWTEAPHIHCLTLWSLWSAAKANKHFETQALDQEFLTWLDMCTGKGGYDMLWCWKARYMDGESASQMALSLFSSRAW